MKIVFYNHFHNGDIFVSRSLVNYVIKNIKADSYEYRHKNSFSLLKDLPLTQSDNMENLDMYAGWELKNETLYCNTWVNAYQERHKGRISIASFYDIFQTGLKETLNYNLDINPLELLPIVDYTFYPIKNLFVGNTCLISNNDTLSGQCDNFSMDEFVRKIVHKKPEYIFLLTNHMGKDIKRDNIIYVDSLIGRDTDNLNEISYLSLLCDVIIGRHSGPYTFALTKMNLLNPSKTFISFANLDPYDFGVSQYTNKHAKFVNSFEHDLDTITRVTLENI